MKKIVFLLVTLFLFSAQPIFAHPGRTDANGGHNCNVGACAGTYHYHNGGSAPAPIQETVQQFIPNPTNTRVPTRIPTRIPTIIPTSTPTPKMTLTPTKNLTPTLIPTAIREAKATMEVSQPKRGFLTWLFSLFSSK